MTATLAQGEVFVQASHLAPGETYSIVTPRGTVSIAQDGHYGIAAGDQANPTTVSVLDGAGAGDRRQHGHRGAARAVRQHQRRPDLSGRPEAAATRRFPDRDAAAGRAGRAAVAAARADAAVGRSTGRGRRASRAPVAPAPNRDPPAGRAGAGEVPPPPAVAVMPGAQDLQQYGAWQQSSDYGSVWYPGRGNGLGAVS